MLLELKLKTKHIFMWINFRRIHIFLFIKFNNKNDFILNIKVLPN